MLCYLNVVTLLQIHYEPQVEEEREKQFVAQAFAHSMKHGGGSKRSPTKPEDQPTKGKGNRDRRRDREKKRDRVRERDKPREKLDARKLQMLLKQREKSKDPVVHVHAYVIKYVI